MGEPAVLWREALAVLATEFPRDQLEAWIAPLRPLKLEAGTLFLGVTSELQRIYLAKNCQGAIEQGLARLAGEPIAVRFELVPQATLFPTPPAAEPARRPARSASAGEEGGLPLNPRYTFDTFVVGNSNRFAHAVAQGTAENPGKAYNPLILYGGVGLGKTHLLHAIGHAVMRASPQKRVVYTTTEKFINDMINSLQAREMSRFRRKYRNMDLLLVDDIQFLQGKEVTQEEFFHTVNDLLSVQHQIVATSDTHPKDIKVEDRLRSRFQGGILADLQAPDLETRIAILRKKALHETLNIPEEVLSFIAETVPSNIRELEGALNRVMALANMSGQAPSLDLARDALRDLVSIRRAPLTFERIQSTVSRYFALDPAALTERSRASTVAYPRQVAMFLCRELLAASHESIGRRFGGRDHTTAIYAIERIRKRSEADEQTRLHLEDLRHALAA